MKKYLILIILIVPLLAWGQTGKWGFCAGSLLHSDSIDVNEAVIDTCNILEYLDIDGIKWYSTDSSGILVIDEYPYDAVYIGDSYDLESSSVKFDDGNVDAAGSLTAGTGLTIGDDITMENGETISNDTDGEIHVSGSFEPNTDKGHDLGGPGNVWNELHVEEGFFYARAIAAGDSVHGHWIFDSADMCVKVWSDSTDDWVTIADLDP